mgnify:FL=1
MSLMNNFNDPRILDVSKRIFEEHFRLDPKLENEMNQRLRKSMYDYIVYNISYLLTSVYFKDVAIFKEYSIWVYELLCHLMKDLDRDRIMEQMVDHFTIMQAMIENHLNTLLTREEIVLAKEHLDVGILAIQEAAENVEFSSNFTSGEYTEIRKAYLTALLMGKTKDAHQVIAQTKLNGIPLLDIYEKILAPTMHEIGELWHRSIITIDKEHYATSVTQNVLSTFYSEIFESQRRNKTLLSCSVGNELHEMGVRMISDIFEYSGWDTYYLGAALPKDAVIKAIREHQPDVIALSVTMQPFLKHCEDLVYEIRTQFPSVLIAVGGQAFTSTNSLWEQWPIDHYSTSGEQLLLWANQTIEHG